MADALKAVNDEHGNINFIGWDNEKVYKTAAGEINKMLGKYRDVVQQERFLVNVERNVSGAFCIMMSAD